MTIPMKHFCIFILAFLCLAPGLLLAADSSAFAEKVDLTPLRAMVVQHNQRIKTLDSFARETLEEITGRSSFDGQDPVFTLLDLSYSPDKYLSANMIKVKNLPLRTEFRRFAFLSRDEQERIVKTAMVSMELIARPEVQQMLSDLQSTDVRKAQAAQQVAFAMQQLSELCVRRLSMQDLFLPAAVVPPAPGASENAPWHRLIDLSASDPEFAAALQQQKRTVPPLLLGYSSAEITRAIAAEEAMATAWKAQDADGFNTAARTFAETIEAINPAAYPSAAKRNVEVVYNHLAKLTLPGAALYFFALACFLMSTGSGFSSLRMWGLRLGVLAFAVHTTGIAVRWWLVGSIPIKNEFESVMFSAWFGVLIGICLEMGILQSIGMLIARKFFGSNLRLGLAGRGIFGAAACFVGWLALIALFTVPYVIGASIGQNIEPVNGVLMSYWLYIHVTMVTASYAMIGTAFAISAWWLVKYYADRGNTQTPVRQTVRQRGFEPIITGSGTAALGLGNTIARMMFFPVAKPAEVEAVDTVATSDFLTSLDACNIVVLQLAFWMLGVGIILGAVWADESWGRPWAFDPKETFALVTWIAYLVIVHVRVVTNHKAWWTSVLAILGCFLMLFNWIGVNYFLPGLHSYAG
jgi:ABC-type transport system involved in cytochrome c biogenesis permease subunit